MRNDRRIIAIADDITGAAEIAGIAHSHGLGVSLFCGSCCCAAAQQPSPTPQVTVVATDTRSMSAAEAISETHRVASSFPIPHTSFLIYKKTDSALRGHVVAELRALMEATGYGRAVYLPANPSKGRIIRAGTYYINNKPIHETDFSFDPEFPARTSSLKAHFPDAEACGILMPDAETTDDIRRVVAQYNDGQTLFAGAADLFTVWLESSCTSRMPKPPETSRTFSSSTLILCGSTQSRALNLGIPVAPMHCAIYDGADDLNLWDITAYNAVHSLILTIPHTHRPGKEVAVHLRTIMAEMTKRLVSCHRPDRLIIEGGATAWATLNALGWTALEIERQVASGVVQMRAPNGTLVTLKPGSYPWGGLFGKE